MCGSYACFQPCSIHMQLFLNYYVLLIIFLSFMATPDTSIQLFTYFILPIDAILLHIHLYHKMNLK